MKKWIQGAIKKPGSLTRIAKKAGGFSQKTGKISPSWLHSKLSALKQKAKGAKKLPKSDLSLLRKILLALKLRGMK